MKAKWSRFFDADTPHRDDYLEPLVTISKPISPHSENGGTGTFTIVLDGKPVQT